jgi:hypothetical protein
MRGAKLLAWSCHADSTVNDRIFVFRDQSFWRNPVCARDNLRIGQQIKRLTNIKEEHLLARSHQRLESFSGDAVLVYFILMFRALYQVEISGHSAAEPEDSRGRSGVQ